MSYRTLIAAALAGTLLTGCLQRFQENERLDLTCSGTSPWADEIIQTAQDTYLYALMAVNAYDETHPRVALPATVRTLDTVGNDAVGFAYNVYERMDEGQPELILAFRGTEPGRLDWITGNFRGKQLPRALEIHDEWTSRPDYSAHRVSVTGDSLGGSLATQVSLCHPVHISVSLNTSPRFSSKLCGPDGAILDANNRHSITESGEILKALRLFGREATQLYTSIDCQTEGPVGDHNVYNLARCLTRIAADGGDASAKALIAANPKHFELYPASTKTCRE